MGLDTVELIIAVERNFDISIRDDAASGLDTVGKLRDFVVVELNRLQRPRVNSDIVLDQLRTIICAQLGVKPGQLQLTTRFVQDLGAD